ncbi:MAG: sugar ABC transporter permease [Oscillospiraceae bacterium]|jgi:multiple sugar transport system permease protein|nr:sugar ABC transporter permease [Oscillospiraceae bacterium]
MVAMDARAAVKRARLSIRRKRLRGLAIAAPFVLPGFALACVFTLYPTLFNIRVSLSSYHIVQRSMTWVGLENFTELFTDRGGRISLAIRNNFLYAIVTTPFILLFGLVFAVMINSLKRFRVFFRTCFYLPVITSWVIVGNVFAYMFNPGGAGLVNYALVDILGIMEDYVPWLQRTWTANAVIWILGIWKNIGWSMIVYLAGLQGVPADLYEASGIEGAGRARQFISITAPMLKNTTFYVLVNMIIGSFGVFVQVLMLTGGNPRGTTSVLQYLLYDKSFNLFEFGQGAAIGVITAILVLITTIVMNRVFRTEGGRVE